MTENILRKIYYDPKHNASFSSVQKLFEAAKEIKNDINLADVKQWLSEQLTYTLHKRAIRNFKRNKILVERINQQFEADLVDMKEFKNQNSGFNYILTVIDCFSKYAFAIPIKTKNSKSIIEAFKRVFNERKCQKLRTDRGTEFLNKDFQNFLKENEVNFFS